MPSASHGISVKRRMLLIGLYLVCNCVYILLGGGVMYILEHDEEVAHLKEMADYVAEVGLNANQSDHLEELGVCTFPNHLTPHWTFTGSAFYAFTVITTIGYGVFAPVTNSGRVFTCFYAIPGISIVAVVLTNIAGLLAEIFEGTLDRRNHRYYEPIPKLSNLIDPATGTVERAGLRRVITSMIQAKPDDEIFAHVCDRISPNNEPLTPDALLKGVALWFQLSSEVPPREKTSFRYLILTLTGVFGWMAIWGVVFASLESWTYAEGLWFSFISLSTIGFGDFVPDTMTGRIFGFIFMAPGLGLMGAFFGVLSNIFKKFQFRVSSSLNQRGMASDKLLEAQGFTSLSKRELYAPLVEEQADTPLEPDTPQLALTGYSPSATSPQNRNSYAAPAFGQFQERQVSMNNPPVVAAAPVDNSNQTTSTCPSGHPLTKMRVGKHTGCSEHACNVCGKNKLKSYVYRCMECDYDVCVGCAVGRLMPPPRSPKGPPAQPTSLAYMVGTPVLGHESPKEALNTSLSLLPERNGHHRERQRSAETSASGSPIIDTPGKFPGRRRGSTRADQQRSYPGGRRESHPGSAGPPGLYQEMAEIIKSLDRGSPSKTSHPAPTFDVV